MKHLHFICSIILSLIASVVIAQQNPRKTPESTEVWEPQPRLVVPASSIGNPPSYAIVLFDGTTADKWKGLDGQPIKWKIADGALTVVKGAQDILTRDEFGDFQLHIEWRSPAVTNPSSQSGQNRGNSGIFLQDRYEVQVLDNFDNRTYANGQAASIYKQHIPLVNASRKPGEWQSYDIIFSAPRFNAEGRVVIPARVTVLHNGVLVQNNVEIWGPSEYIGLPVYQAHGKGPIRLQDHGDAVSYRNIWIREL